MSREEAMLTADEVRKYFEDFMRKLQVSARTSLSTDMEVSDEINGVGLD